MINDFGQLNAWSTVLMFIPTGQVTWLLTYVLLLSLLIPVQLTAAGDDYAHNNIQHNFLSVKQHPQLDSIFRIFTLLLPDSLFTFSAAKYCKQGHIAPHDDRAYTNVCSLAPCSVNGSKCWCQHWQIPAAVCNHMLSCWAVISCSLADPAAKGLLKDMTQEYSAGFPQFWSTEHGPYHSWQLAQPLSSVLQCASMRPAGCQSGHT